jgi:hypothetical protein
MHGLVLRSIERISLRDVMESSDRSPNRNRPSPLVPLVIWAVFFSGLLLQLFSPHLRISHDSFVIPQDAVSQGSVIDPRALIAKERTIQLCSALLTLAGAIGLAVYYRRTLLKYVSRSRE